MLSSIKVQLSCLQRCVLAYYLCFRMLTLPEKIVCVSLMFIQKLCCFDVFHCCNFSSAAFVLELLGEEAILALCRTFPFCLVGILMWEMGC